MTSAGRLLAIAAVVCAFVAPAHAAVVINEIMYNSTGSPDVEYVELYNTGPNAQDMTNWYLLDDDLLHDHCLLSGTIQPGGYLVVPGFTNLFTATYPGVTNLNPNQFDNPLTGRGFSLGNNGDIVRLFNPSNVLVDEVAYGDLSPWPTAPDGGGPSLELFNPAFDNSVASSWGASINGPPGGTPGQQNSVFTVDEPPLIELLTRDIALPKSDDSVVVTARVTDDLGLGTVQLEVDAGSGFASYPMLDDGLHGDGAAGDTVYGAAIAPQPSATLVRYYVSATDSLPQTVTEPPLAPAEYRAYTVGYQPPLLRINELLASNLNGIRDEANELEDWLEIRNASPHPVDLGSMFLSDNLGRTRKWGFPATILDPGGFVIVWCDDNQLQGPLHANFKLAKELGEIGLFDTENHGNVLINGWTYGVQNSNVSFGYYPDDSDAPEYLVIPTPGGSNNVTVLFSPVVINELHTTSAFGGVDDWVELYNRGGATVDISGWHISDSAAVPVRYPFPAGTLLSPGGHISVDEVTLGFSFSSTGDEVVMLTAADGTTGQDYFDYGPQQPDISQGRYPDGTSNWEFFMTTSRGLENTCAGGGPIPDQVQGLKFESPAAFDWQPAVGAQSYDIVKGRLDLLHSSGGDFSVAVSGCLQNNSPVAESWDPGVPPAGGGYFYLIRGVSGSCGFGSYDSGSPSQIGSRDAEIAASSTTCP